MTIDSSVHIQLMVSIHWSKIGSPIPIYLNEGEPSKYSSTIGCTKYNGLNALCQKICCSELLKRIKQRVYSLIKSCIEYDD
jgi:hypothetical protein